jgi:hypothetical protein
MSVTSGDKYPFYSIVKNWAARFIIVYLSNEKEVHSGKPTQVRIPENVNTIHSMIMDD